MPNVGDLVDETQTWLHAAWRPELNELNASVSSFDDTLTMKYDLKGIVPGSYITLGDELLYVWSTQPETKVVNVRRGVQGSTAASHNASTLAEVNPTFPRFHIKRALQEEVRSWPTSVYQVAVKTISASDNFRAQGIECDLGDYHHILRVQHVTDSTSTKPKSWPSLSNYRHDRQADTTDFPSGQALYVEETVPTGSIRVTYSRPFTTDNWDDAIDLEAQVGLSASMLDIPPIGAAVRLQAGREVSRSLTRPAGDPRLAESVPPNSILQGAFGLQQLRDRRLAEEARKLAARYPLGHN